MTLGFKVKINALISCFLGGIFLLLIVSNSANAAEKFCSYDSKTGKPNPLGMRTYITVETREGNTIFIYEQFPSIVAEKITISNRRELVFYGINIKKARQILLKNPKYYYELVGYEDPDGFAPVNAVLTCE